MNEEWKAHLKKIASKGGQSTKKKGADYFKAIRSKRVNYPKKNEKE